MKRLWWMGLLLWSSGLHAAEVTITLPDARFQSALHDLCAWHRCQATTPEGQAQEVADLVVRLASLNHYADLAAIDGTLTVRMDAP